MMSGLQNPGTMMTDSKLLPGSGSDGGQTYEISFVLYFLYTLI